jgi:outer membrane protein assembly factor BamB
MLLIKGGGIRTVFDTKTGQPLKSPQRIENISNYYASPIAGDGKIYVAGENGVVVVLKNSGDYEVLAKNDMDESIIATPAIADGSLFIRTRTKVLAIGAGQAAASKSKGENRIQ